MSIKTKRLIIYPGVGTSNKRRITDALTFVPMQVMAGSIERARNFVPKDSYPLTRSVISADV